MTTNPYESPEHRSDLARQPAGWIRFVVRLMVIVGALVLLAALLLPALRFPGDSVRRMRCTNNLKQIGLALQSYADAYHCLPPAYTVDSAGKPLHSWRTLILPFVEQDTSEDALGRKIDLSKAWDDPANRAAREVNPPIYRCPSVKASQALTTYFAVIIPGGCFKHSIPTPITAIIDGPGLTLMVVEVPEKYAVHWMSPNDATEEMILNRADAKFSHPNGSMAVFADGHTELLSKNLSDDVLRALISIDGNDNKIAENH